MLDSNEIFRIALLGTANSKEISEGLLTEMEHLGIKIDTNQNAERQVLSLLSAFALLRKTAVQLPKAGVNKITAPEIENSMPCSELSSELLDSLISQNQPELVSEWLSLHIEKKQVVSANQLVNLLNFGLKHPFLQDSIAVVSGKKGIWMSGFNPDWNYCKALSLDDFNFGTKQKRLDFFIKLRNKNPERALQLLEKNWEQEPYQLKVAFLKLLSNKLSEADIPFLEMTLKDPNTEVKKEALFLLSCLAGSEITKKLNAIFFEYVKIKSSDKLYFELNLPDQLPDELRSYGIIDNMPLKADFKSNLLAQLVAVLPIDYWNNFDLKIEHILESFSSNPYNQAWYWGLTQAAIRSKNEAWLEKLHIFIHQNQSTPKYDIKFSVDFMSDYLSDTVYNKLCLYYLNSIPDALSYNEQYVVMKLLLEPNRKWTDELAVLVMKNIRLLIIQRRSIYVHNQTNLLKSASFSMNPKLLPYFEKWPEELSASWQTEINNFKSVMELRMKISGLFDRA